MFRPRFSYANVVSSLALFIALGGTSYAVTQLPRNSVGGKQLKANSVTSAKIRPRAIQRSDLAPSARVGSRGTRGPVGPTGSTGATGPSETIQVKRPGVVNIPAGAGGSATLVSLTLDAGSWLLDANTAVIMGSGSGQDWLECRLRTAAGQELAKSVLRVGTDPGSTHGGPLPVRVAATFNTATQVGFVCDHNNALAGQPYADRTTFQATRVGRLEER